jgi:hypothetical protein
VPAFVAARQGRTAVLRVLAAAGADLDAHSSRTPAYQPFFPGFSGNTRTPLMVACDNGDAACVAVLLELGANPNVGSADGFTPCMIAAARGHLDCLRTLGNGGPGGAFLSVNDSVTGLASYAGTKSEKQSLGPRKGETPLYFVTFKPKSSRLNKKNNQKQVAALLVEMGAVDRPCATCCWQCCQPCCSVDTSGTPNYGTPQPTCSQMCSCCCPGRHFPNYENDRAERETEMAAKAAHFAS